MNEFSVQKVDHQLIKYTDVAKGHFMPLVYLDLIKEKNKPTGGK